MRKLAITLSVCAGVGAGAFWILTSPAALPVAVVTGHTPDPANGALVFAAGGCSSCHAAPASEDKTVLAGEYAIESPFGTFYSPNISNSEEGIAGWSLPKFTRALRQGVSPEGRHYYPAFPYTAYSRMTDTDVADLFSYMTTLPADQTPSLTHEVRFPFNVTRGIGLWKLLYLTDGPVLEGELSAELLRGRYLVEGLTHCGECHTARDALGGLDLEVWLEGAPSPSGKGRIPAITPSKLDWSQRDIASYLRSGFTPDYDSVGGSMAAVVANPALLPESDTDAISAYLKALSAP